MSNVNYRLESSGILDVLNSNGGNNIGRNEGGVLILKSFIAGDGIIIDDSGSNLTINTKELIGGTNVNIIETPNDFTINAREIIGGTNVSVVDNGTQLTISSVGGAGGGDEISGVASTTNTSSSIIASIPVSINTINGYELRLSTANQTDNLGSFHKIETAFKNVGGTITQVDPPANCVDFTEPGYLISADSNVSFVVSGGNVEIQVSGILGKTIAWTIEGSIISTNL